VVIYRRLQDDFTARDTVSGRSAHEEASREGCFGLVSQVGRSWTESRLQAYPLTGLPRVGFVGIVRPSSGGEQCFVAATTPPKSVYDHQLLTSSHCRVVPNFSPRAPLIIRPVGIPTSWVERTLPCCRGCTSVPGLAQLHSPPLQHQERPCHGFGRFSLDPIVMTLDLTCGGQI
jgi:hypothetical protein